ADVLARTLLTPPGNPPIRFQLPIDLARIRPDHRYVVRARIVDGDRIMFTSDESHPVLAQGHGTTVAIMLRRAGSGPSGSPAPSADRPDRSRRRTGGRSSSTASRWRLPSRCARSTSSWVGRAVSVDRTAATA